MPNNENNDIFFEKTNKNKTMRTTKRNTNKQQLILNKIKKTHTHKTKLRKKISQKKMKKFEIYMENN